METPGVHSHLVIKPKGTKLHCTRFHNQEDTGKSTGNRFVSLQLALTYPVLSFATWPNRIAFSTNPERRQGKPSPISPPPALRKGIRFFTPPANLTNQNFARGLAHTRYRTGIVCLMRSCSSFRSPACQEQMPILHGADTSHFSPLIHRLQSSRKNKNKRALS